MGRTGRATSARSRPPHRRALGVPALEAGYGDVVLGKALAREKNDLQSARGDQIFEALVPLLPADGFHPFSLVADEWQARSYRWHFHDRPYSLWVGDLVPPERAGLRLCLRQPWGTRQSVSGAFTVLSELLEPNADLLELAALGRVRERAWSEDIERRIEARLTERLGVFASQVRSAHLNARIVGPRGESLTPPRIDPESRFAAWLERLVEWALHLTYPPTPPSRSSLRANVVHVIACARKQEHGGDSALERIEPPLQRRHERRLQPPLRRPSSPPRTCTVRS